MAHGSIKVRWYAEFRGARRRRGLGAFFAAFLYVYTRAGNNTPTRRGPNNELARIGQKPMGVFGIGWQSSPEHQDPSSPTSNTTRRRTLKTTIFLSHHVDLLIWITSFAHPVPPACGFFDHARVMYHTPPRFVYVFHFSKPLLAPRRV